MGHVIEVLCVNRRTLPPQPPQGNRRVAWRVVWLDKAKKQKCQTTKKAWVIKETIFPAMADSEFKPLSTHTGISQSSINNLLKAI